MIGEPGKAAVYAYCAATDMRKGYEELSSLVREELGEDSLSGALFLFTNRRRTHAKVLCFDGVAFACTPSGSSAGVPRRFGSAPTAIRCVSNTVSCNFFSKARTSSRASG